MIIVFIVLGYVVQHNIVLGSNMDNNRVLIVIKIIEENKQVLHMHLDVRMLVVMVIFFGMDQT